MPLAVGWLRLLAVEGWTQVAAKTAALQEVAVQAPLLAGEAAAAGSGQTAAKTQPRRQCWSALAALGVGTAAAAVPGSVKAQEAGWWAGRKAAAAAERWAAAVAVTVVAAVATMVAAARWPRLQTSQGAAMVCWEVGWTVVAQAAGLAAA